jgi:UDP-3-O-[3-hydroxymyristoyl] glucosamine N-acyltransferase
MKRTVKELAALVAGQIVGDEKIEITGVASIEQARPGDIVFVESAKYFSRALDSHAAAIVAPASLSSDKKTLILADHPKLAFAQIVSAIAVTTRPPAAIHASAIIDAETSLPACASVGAYSVIGAHCSIGINCIIGAHCSIGDNVEIGNDCVIHANVTIYAGAKIGNRVVIHSGSVIGSDGFGYVFHQGQYHKFPQVGKVIIEDDVELGANVCVDRGALDATIIGRGSKIDNLVQIAHNVRIGSNTVLAAQVGISGSSVIEENVVLGGQVGIADHVRIEKGAIVGAQGGVPTGKIIRRGITVWGTPARPIDEFKHIYAHSQQLPALKQRVIELEKRLAAMEEERRATDDDRKK